MAKILLVDDRSDVVGPLADLFNAMDKHQAEVAYSASEAKQKLQSGSFDMVISDYEMPQEDGVALARWLSQEKHGIPFILISGLGEKQIEATNPAYTGLKSSCAISAFAMKPIRYTDIEPVIDDILAKPKPALGMISMQEGKIGI